MAELKRPTVDLDSEWIVTADGRWHIVNPVQDISEMVAVAREMSARNRAVIRQSRELIERIRRARRARRAWALPLPRNVH